jgi:hypothetical protein
MNDLEHRITAAMAAVAETTNTTRAPALSDSPVRPPGRRRIRILLACLAGIAIPLGGLAAASEAGLLPSAAQRAFPWEGHPADNFGVDLKTAYKIADVPGPDGHRLELWVGKAKPQHVCTALFLAKTATPDHPEGSFGAACYGHPDVTAFGSVLDTNVNGPLHLFAFGAGRSVRGTLTRADGRSVPVAVSGGVFIGWVAATDLHPVVPGGFPTERVTFTGYDAAGHEVGAFSTHLQ